MSDAGPVHYTRHRTASAEPALPAEGTSTTAATAAEGGAHPTAPRLRRPVAFVVSRFPKVTETFILREIEELERQGRPVRLVPLLEHRDEVVQPRARPWVEEALYTPFLSGAILRENVAAFREHPVRYLRILGRVVVGSASGLRALAGAVSLFPKAVFLGRRLAREGVGHIHAHFATHPATVAHIASAFTGVPYSFTAHAHDIFLASSRPLLKQKVRAASFVRAISDYNRRFLEARYGAARGKVRVVHMGLDPSDYQRAAVHPARIVCVASLRPYKGITTLIEACARPPLRERSFELLLVGDGPQRGRLTRRVRRLGLEDRVHLLGVRTEDEVSELLSTAELFVHPSCVTRAGWMDGIPVALMEAMATGVPVVSTWVSGIPELLAHGEAGRLVFPSNPDELAEALAALLADPDAAAAMAERGRRMVEEHFGLEHCVGQLAELLDRHSVEAPAVADTVTRALRAEGPEAQVALRRLHERPDSTVAEVSVTGPPGAGRRERVVKVHREVTGAERTAEQRATVEFDTVRLLGRDGRPDGSAAPPVPTALSLARQEAALVLERVAARPLDERIRRWRRHGRRELERRLVPSVRAAGVWLRWFQDRTRVAPTGGCWDIAAGVRARALDDLASVESRLPPGLAKRAGGVLDACDPACVARGHAPVGHHCDFWPGNVLEADAQVTVIDFEGFRHGLPYQDVARFLVHLDLALARPWLATCGTRAETAFLDGYGAGDDLDGELWTLCLSAEALALLARDAEGTRGGGTGPSAWWRARRAVSWLERAVSGDGGPP